MNISRTFEFIKKYKFIIIALAAGLILLLLPRTASGQARDAPDVETEYSSPTTAQLYNSASAQSDEEKLNKALSKIEGAENVTVVLSDKGAVIICSNLTPELKLRITQAVSVFTGFSSEKIIILKGA